MQFLSSGSWCFSWERHVTFSALSVYAGPSFWNALHHSLFPPLPDQLLCTFGSSAPHLLRCLPACFSTPMARCLSRGMIIVSVFGNLPDCKLLQFVRPSLSILFSEGLAHSNFLVTAGRLPRWCSGKRICLPSKRHGFKPWGMKIPWSRKRQPTLVFLPEESHGQRSLAGHSAWDHKESDTNVHLSRTWPTATTRRAWWANKDAANTLRVIGIKWQRWYAVNIKRGYKQTTQILGREERIVWWSRKDSWTGVASWVCGPCSQGPVLRRAPCSVVGVWKFSIIFEQKDHIFTLHWGS